MPPPFATNLITRLRFSNGRTPCVLHRLRRALLCDGTDGGRVISQCSACARGIVRRCHCWSCSSCAERVGVSAWNADIKLSNLLINGKGEVKIADTEWIPSNGTCAYMSPEMVDPERWSGDDNADRFAGNVWSLGVVLLGCLIGHDPLNEMEEKPDWVVLICAICWGV